MDYFLNEDQEMIRDLMKQIAEEKVVPVQGFGQIHIHDEFKDDFITRHSEIIREMHFKNKPFFIFFSWSCSHLWATTINLLLRNV